MRPSLTYPTVVACGQPSDRFVATVMIRCSSRIRRIFFFESLVHNPSPHSQKLDENLVEARPPPLMQINAANWGYRLPYMGTKNPFPQIARHGRLDPSPPPTPLELTAATIFAALFVVISLVSAWVRSQFGERGLFGAGKRGGKPRDAPGRGVQRRPSG